MITVGLVKELFYIASALKTDVQASLSTNFNTPLNIKIHKNVLQVWYQDWHIWTETVEGDTSFFGVESCDSISRIIACMNNNDMQSAQKLMFYEDSMNSLDKIPSPS